MTIKDRLARREPEDIIYIGEKIEAFLDTEIADIIEALTAGRIAFELQVNRDGKLSSDRVLGRCEMGEQLWQDLGQYVVDKNQLLEPKPHGGGFEYEGAVEPIPTT